MGHHPIDDEHRCGSDDYLRSRKYAVANQALPHLLDDECESTLTRGRGSPECGSRRLERHFERNYSLRGQMNPEIAGITSCSGAIALEGFDHYRRLQRRVRNRSHARLRCGTRSPGH